MKPFQRIPLLLGFALVSPRVGSHFWKGMFGLPRHQHRPQLQGGDHVHHNSNERKNVTRIEEYVADVEQRDAQDRRQQTNSKLARQTTKEYQDNGEHDPPQDPKAWEKESSKTPSDQRRPPQSENTDAASEAAAVGVKSHHHKKSGSVGDADSDDDDDESDSDTSDWEEFLEEQQGGIENMLVGGPTQLEVEVEFVEDEEHDTSPRSADNDHGLKVAAGGGGGVGVIVNQGRRNSRARSVATATFAQSPVKEQEMLEAWLSHVYLPPSKSGMDYLTSNSRMIDGASKTRLDRRTLYACLMLEWIHANATYRKFLETSTSQALQAALALATQPQWRRCSSQRLCGIRLYDTEEERGCTLAMQETIIMALGHSLGAGVVVLEDRVLSAVRRELLAKGYAEEDVKPALLIQWLLEVAREGKLAANPGAVTGSLSLCMKDDLHNGLDDPFDERALNSWHEMNEWEAAWNDQPLDDEGKELPLVIFVRAESSRSLLKSKSAVELLLQEANSDEGINLVVIGKGLDANTDSLPEEGSSEVVPPSSGSKQQPGPPNGAPWFGFSPHNQNASGQNDPEGSRRFNIFLSRTVDADGTPGILGAIAPPQAGNLFPHMMAMQAHERLQNQDMDSPVKAELERWAQMLQDQSMNANRGSINPQFFNATLSGPPDNADQPNIPPPSPEIMQKTLQAAMSELLDRLAQMSEEETDNNSASLHKAFAQVLRNENLRRGITENLARAAPALSDPKCQGVMLSVYVPPPPTSNSRMQNQKNLRPQNNMNGWFQRILNNQEEASMDAKKEGISDEDREHSKQRRVRTMAAAAAVAAANQAQASKDAGKDTDKMDKYERNLARLESVCRPILVETPSDPVRAKSWDTWIARERGSVVFRVNRQALNHALEGHSVTIQDHTGTQSAGSALRGMLSVRDITNDMDEIVQCAIEIEAQKSQMMHVSPEEMHESEKDLEVDVSLSQLFLSDDGTTSESSLDLRFLHPSSVESAINMICRISPSPSGGLSVSSVTPSHRTKDEIATLAQDKHERALVSQVVSPQDIGVTYDMIGGLSEVKELLRQSITYPLKFPHLYSEGIAREAVKGVLLFGPPGTGKTMLAKALASEGGASFLSVDASSIENKWLGESEKNAKAVFTLARRLAPCVVFIDEVDSLLSSREGTSDDSAHGTLTSVKTTMMSEWDGLNSGTNGVGEAGSDRVVVIGSTNRPFDLDEAVLRRFPRRILVDLPDLQTRKEILEVTLAENRLDPAVNLTKVAERLEGYTGSDIKEVCREAVVRISHEQAKLLDQGFSDSREDQTQGSLQRLRPVTMSDFDDALKKLKRSVSETGRELARVWEWNDEYGEIKKDKKNRLPQLANMYL